MEQVFNGFPAGALDLSTSNFSRVSFINGSNYTTTSASLVAIDDANLSVSVLALPGDPIELIFQAPFGNSGSGQVTGFDWAVDRPSMADLTSLAQYWNSTAYSYTVIELGQNAFDDNNFPSIGHYVALEAGIHIFKPRWRTGGGTASIVCQGAAGARPWAVTHSAKVIH